MTLPRPFPWRPIYDALYIDRESIVDEQGYAILADGTPSKVLLPETLRDKEGTLAQWTGTVIAVGPGRLNLSTGLLTPLLVQEGDRVAFGRYVGQDIELPLVLAGRRRTVKVLAMNEKDVRGYMPADAVAAAERLALLRGAAPPAESLACRPQ